MSKETSFVKNAEELAKQKMDAINPELSSKFKFLIKFLSQFPEACSKPRSKKMQNKVGQEEHIEYLARSFHESRLPRKPTPPTTVPDEVVSIVLNISFNIQPENLERIKEEHRFSMAAENIVGDLLERFLKLIPYSVAEPPDLPDGSSFSARGSAAGEIKAVTTVALSPMLPVSKPPTCWRELWGFRSRERKCFSGTKL